MKAKEELFERLTARHTINNDSVASAAFDIAWDVKSNYKDIEEVFVRVYNTIKSFAAKG